MSKTVVIITVVVLITSALIVGWSFFDLKTIPFLSAPQKSTQSQTPPQSTSQVKPSLQATRSAQIQSNNPTLPVNIQNPAVKGAQVLYTFTTTIKEIMGTPSAMTLITSINADNLPTFTVTKDTKVNYVSSGQKTATDSSVLAAGQTVEIVISYGLKKKAWNNIATVNIINSQPTPIP